MKWKNVISLLLALTVLLSLCGCGAAREEEAGPSPAGAQAQPTPEPTPDPRTLPEYHSTEKIQERGVLQVAVSQEGVMIYLVPDDSETYGELAGTRAGYISELCRRIAQELEVELEFVECENLQAQLEAVETGEADLAADCFTINEERLALYEMTDDISVVELEGDEIFLSVNPQPWLKEEEPEETPASTQEPEETPAPTPEPREMIRSEEELARARIAVLRGSVQETNAKKQFPEAEIHPLADNQEILDALIAGEVDAGVFTTFNKMFAELILEAILDGTVAQCGYYLVPQDTQGIGFIIMQGNEDLCQTINGILSRLRESGWLEECYYTEMAKAADRGIR